MSEKREQKGIRGSKELVETFSKLAWENDTTPPQLLNAVMKAIIAYADREGEIPTPFELVPKREMELFRTWSNRHQQHLAAAEDQAPYNPKIVIADDESADLPKRKKIRKSGAATA